MPINNDHNPDQDEFARIVGDLRTMPRVKAPSNLQYLLEQRIQESLEPKESWWKRFFLSGFDIGGFRIPAYAYGPVAAAVVVVVGLYVFNVTNFGLKLDSPESDQMIGTEELRPQPEPTENAPVYSENEQDKQPTEMTEQSERANEFRSGRRDAQYGTGTNMEQPAPPPPASIPQPPTENLPASKTAPVGGSVQSEDEMNMPRTRGMPDVLVPDRKTEEETMELKDADVGKERNEEATIDDRGKDKKSLLEKSDLRQQVHGFGEASMSMPAAKDSARFLDSLRRLDSLRTLKKQQ